MTDVKIEIDFATVPFTERQKRKLYRILTTKVYRWYAQAKKREDNQND